MTEIEVRIRDSFPRQSLMATFKARVETVAPGPVTVTAPITDAVLQQKGAAHAGLTFALEDTAAGYAAHTRLDGGEVMTAEMKINLLARCRPGSPDHRAGDQTRAPIGRGRR